MLLTFIPVENAARKASRKNDDKKAPIKLLIKIIPYENSAQDTVNKSLAEKDRIELIVRSIAYENAAPNFLQRRCWKTNVSRCSSETYRMKMPTTSRKLVHKRDMSERLSNKIRFDLKVLSKHWQNCYPKNTATNCSSKL